MTDSASHDVNKQFLQKQAKQMLPSVTKALAVLGYLNISHQRLSLQKDPTQSYQGLSRALSKRFSEVMIKWQLSADSSTDLTSFNLEIEVLKALNSLQTTDKKANQNPIAPLVLAYETLSLKLLEPNQRLTALVMPYYRQGSLAQYLKQPISDKKKHQLIVKAAEVIDRLHQARWVHNDIKPSNLLISNDKALSLLLTDFALAEPIENSGNIKASIDNSAGTPAYLAPERWQGQGGTLQSDIYAFGIIMYEILVGARPYAIESSTGDPFKDWALQHCQQPIPTLPSEYSHYQDIIEKALAKRVEGRYLSMKGVLKNLKL